MDREFIDLINEKLLYNERIFKVQSVVLYKEKDLVVTFISSKNDYDRVFTEELRDKLTSIIEELIPEKFTVEVRCKKSTALPNDIKQKIYKYVYSNYPMYFSTFSLCEIEISLTSGSIDISIPLEEQIFDFFDGIHFDEVITRYLECEYMESAFVSIRKVPNSPITEERLKSFKPSKVFQPIGMRLVDIKITKNLFGKVTSVPTYIVDSDKTESERECVCGKIVKLRKFTSKKIEEETELQRNTRIYIMKIDDTSDTMNVKYFAKKVIAEEMADTLKEGDCIVVEGKVSFDNYDQSYSMLVNKLAIAEIDFGSVDVSVHYNPAPDSYVAVKPKEFVATIQDNVVASAVDISPLAGSRYVLFSLILSEKGEIVQMDALSLDGGVLTQSLSSRVRISTDDGVLSRLPSLSDVIGDFYKFFGNDVVLFSQPKELYQRFLSEAKKVLYNIENNVYYIENMLIKGTTLKKYQYETACKALDIPYDNTSKAEPTQEMLSKIYVKLLLKERI